MPYPKYVFENALTSEGKKLVHWLEINIAEALAPGASPHLFNGMSGPLKEYASIVRGPSQYPVDKWLTTFHQSANNAWQIMTDVEEAANAKAAEAAKLNETVDRTSKLEAALTELKESLSAKVSELEVANAALVAENEALKAKPAVKGGKKPVVDVATPESEAEAEKPADAPESE